MDHQCDDHCPVAERLPYRFEATESPYAGTTFVYYPGDIVISYTTENPEWFFRTWGRDPSERSRNSRRWQMTADKLAEFQSVPLKAAG